MFSKNNPAKNINELLEFLLKEEKNNYLYRGQIKEYPGPLLPSLFRKYQKTGRYFTPNDAEFKYSYKKVGNSYVELDPFVGWYGIDNTNMEKETIKDFDQFNKALMLLMTHIKHDVVLSNDILDDFMKSIFPENLYGSTIKYIEIFKNFLNNTHKRYIREVVFSVPLGRLIGYTIAQQYGFSSGFLDVTTSPKVAAFFATHKSPEFQQYKDKETLGIIYCFPRKKPDYFDIYSLANIEYQAFPSDLVVREIVTHFESDDPDFNIHYQYYTKNAYEAIVLYDSILDTLKLPKNWISYSRLGRQCAAVLIPDRIVDPYSELPEPFHYKNNRFIPANIFAIEDLGTRNGMKKFYFKHTDKDIEEFKLTREFLWPKDADFMLILTKSLLFHGIDVTVQYAHTGYLLNHIPRRADLVDTGFEYNIFSN